MPNGRSGGFLIRKGDLTKVLEALPDGSRVGPSLASAVRAKALASPTPGLRATEVVALVDAFTSDDVWIEEQDHDEYMIHLDPTVEGAGRPDPTKWILVASDSPLFLPLRQHHEQYRATGHPEILG